MTQQPRGRVARIIDGAEETLIALILGLMALITFVNVILRYVFNDALIWGLEVVLILFAWLVLLGISYGVKKTAHLGVDAVTDLLPEGPKRFVTIIACIACIVYAALLMKGAWDFWAPYAALQPTTGRWLPGVEHAAWFNFSEWQRADGLMAEGVRDRAFMITDQVPMLSAFRWLEDAINYGDSYDKLPRVIPYTALPLGVGLLLLRFVQAFVAILRGTRHGLIVSHEAEDAVAELSANSRADGPRHDRERG